MELSLTKLQDYLATKKVEQSLASENVARLQHELESLHKEEILVEKARDIIRHVGKLTQEQLEIKISELVSMALYSIFREGAYKMDVTFVNRRNKMECDLMFANGDDLLDPLDSTGGGAVDVASLALRVASYALQPKKTRPVIVLDEPLRFLDKTRQSLASEMITQLANKLNLQFLIVTHEQELTSMADKIYKVQQGLNNVTKVSEI